VIGYRDASIPFSYVTGDGQPLGYAVDLCLRLADSIKSRLRLPRLDVLYVPVDPKTRIPALIDGKIDLECGSTTNNSERRKQVAFTIPHYISGSRILVRSDSGIRGLDDLKGRTVVTTRGTTSVNLLKAADESRLLHMNVIEASDHAAAFAMVDTGKADAFVMDDVLLFSLRSTSAHPEKFKIVGQYLSIEPYAIMFRKDDPEFKKVIDATMADIINSYQINGIYDKWFLSPIPPKGTNLELPISYLLRDSFKFPSDKVGD
jgi:glutamate/aspartate transport system substrate-binding protein